MTLPKLKRNRQFSTAKSSAEKSASPSGFPSEESIVVKILQRGLNHNGSAADMAEHFIHTPRQIPRIYTDKTDPPKPKPQVLFLAVLVVKSVVKILQEVLTTDSTDLHG
jgi:hypothetical protein